METGAHQIMEGIFSEFEKRCEERFWVIYACLD